MMFIGMIINRVEIVSNLREELGLVDSGQWVVAGEMVNKKGRGMMKSLSLLLSVEDKVI